MCPVCCCSKMETQYYINKIIPLVLCVKNNNNVVVYSRISLCSSWSLFSLISPYRQGYAEDYPRPNRSAYEDYYANYYKYMGKYSRVQINLTITFVSFSVYTCWCVGWNKHSLLVLTLCVDQNRWYDPNTHYDPRYRSYYEQAYGWYNYDSEAYRRHDPYFSQQYSNRYTFMLAVFFWSELSLLVYKNV